MTRQRLTVDQAYAAMYEFLASQYEASGSDDIGVLLGSMSLLADGKPADPALRLDWLKAVDRAISRADEGP